MTGRLTSLVAGLALVVTACSGGPAPFASVASSPGGIGVGEQRLLLALIDQDTQEFLAAPDRPATVTLRDETGSPLDTDEAGFAWTVPDVRGLYVANLRIPEPATYQVTIDAEGLEAAGPVGFTALEDPPVIQPGDEAPRSSSRTVGDFPDLSLISSDPEPDPGMYEMSVAEAVTNGRPSLIIFATPAFCLTQTCGPLLDQVKALRGDVAGVDFVHVEVFEDLQVESREELVTVPAVEEWGLPSEPWVFVVDAGGLVVSSFEGVASDEELIDAVKAVSP